ncbi:hypothetical protein [Crucivirus-266]|nr:hypothetical protein [Crucivirus-265]QMW68751.1 hypothetical protein [Crucivirus-266]
MSRYSVTPRLPASKTRILRTSCLVSHAFDHHVLLERDERLQAVGFVRKPSKRDVFHARSHLILDRLQLVLIRKRIDAEFLQPGFSIDKTFVGLLHSSKTFFQITVLLP